MFDPERLLKQVMREALGGTLGGKHRRQHRSYGSPSGGLGSLLGSGGGIGRLLGGGGSGLSTSSKATLGLGALGLAIAAYEHYTAKNTASSAQPSAPPPTSAVAPPPPPPAASSPAPVAGPMTSSTTASAPEDAMHFLRAMVCAAHADGLIDAEERTRILASARDAGLDADDLATLEGELAAPLTPAQLVARTRPAQREPVYIASVIAIGRDTDAEQRYLDDLAQRLGLDAGRREALHQQLGL